MFKVILLFIKSHIVASTITATIVAGAIIATPIVVENYKLDKNVKENLGMLVSSNYKTINNNETTTNTITDNNEISNNNELVNTDEPLTFRIEEIYTKTEGGNIVKDMQGDDAYEMSSEGIEYKIVPSYDKDYSKWTKKEKEAYQKACEDAARMAKEHYDEVATNEEKIMQELEKKLNEQMANDWKTRTFDGAGSLEYCVFTARVRGTILGESFDVSYQEFVDTTAPHIQEKLDKRRPVPKSKDGSYYFGDEGIPEEEANKISAADSFEFFTNEIKENLELRNSEN